MNDAPVPNSQTNQQILLTFTVEILINPKHFSVKSVKDEPAPKDVAGFYYILFRSKLNCRGVEVGDIKQTV